MKIGELVETYVKLRDRKAERKAQYEQDVAKLDLAMQKIEVRLLDHFNETGSESVRTDSGTAYKSIKTSASIADRDSWFSWVLADPDERMTFVEARCSKKAVDEYVAEHGDLPPGVNYSQVAQVNIRRSS